MSPLPSPEWLIPTARRPGRDGQAGEMGPEGRQALGGGEKAVRDPAPLSTVLHSHNRRGSAVLCDVLAPLPASSPSVTRRAGSRPERPHEERISRRDVARPFR